MNAETEKSPRRMLFHFSLYGFLKNQQYYDPFLMLFLLQALNQDFFRVGLLIGYREVLINIFEVPSGAVADLYGRRRSMMFSFCAYIASFTIFAFSSALWQLFAAMSFFALGDAFRTGTHKAMIFGYLQREGRSDEKTKYYGTTRSWSKMGSALSVIIASGLVFGVAAAQRGSEAIVYRYLFLACIVPYLMGLANFACYPQYLDGTPGRKPSIGKIFTHLLVVARDSVKIPSLRGLLGESMGYEGLYKVAKDYLQPIVKTMALSLPLLAGLKGMQRTAGLILVVYVALYLLESLASRKSDTVRRKLGGEEHGARFLWKLSLGVFFVIAAGLALDWYLGGMFVFFGLGVAIAGFMALAVLQNLWRPLHMGRFDTAGDEKAGATILSVESQAKSLSAAIIAPLLGLAVNAMKDSPHVHSEHAKFMPVALTGLLFAAVVLLLRRGSPPRAGSGPAPPRSV